MRTMIALGLAAALCACGRSPAQNAMDRYEMVVRHGSGQEKCDAAREVAAAYLREGDEQKYTFWRAMASTRCMAVDLGTAD